MPVAEGQGFLRAPQSVNNKILISFLKIDFGAVFAVFFEFISKWIYL